MSGIGINSTMISDIISTQFLFSIILVFAAFFLLLIFWKTVEAVASKISNVLTEKLTHSFDYFLVILREKYCIARRKIVVKAPENRFDTLSYTKSNGEITIAVSDSQPCYIGEKVQFGGKCTSWNSVYLAIKTQDLDKDLRKLDRLSVICLNNDPNTFVKVNVDAFQTWFYEWDTSLLSTQLIPSTYDIYVIEGPYTLENLMGRTYGIVAIEIREPFISEIHVPSIIVQGDQLLIQGTVRGEPKAGVQIWVVGKNTTITEIVPVFKNTSFIYELNRTITRNLSPGRYDVIVQHPMYNNEFDVYPDSKHEVVLGNFPKKGSIKFTIKGEGSINGSKAANALTDAINDPNIDDIFKKNSFEVKELIVRIASIGNKIKGKKFTIHGITNLSVNSEVIIEVIQSEFDSANNRVIGKFIKVIENLKVIEGHLDSIGVGNTFSYNLDTSYLMPSLYQVKIFAVTHDVVASETFELC